VLKYWNYVRPDGVVIGRREGSNRFFYHRDHLGSTRTVLSQNSTPTVIETYDYMPFGEFMSGRITTSGTGTRPKFTGHAFDDETNLHNMHWRRQIPRYGVFRTPDPMSDSYPGWNSYAYVMNDPMSYTDPTGMFPCGDGDNEACKLPEGTVTAKRDGASTYPLTIATWRVIQADARTPDRTDIMWQKWVALGTALAALYVKEAYIDPYLTTSSVSIDWNNAPSSPEELSDEWVETPTLAPNRRDFVNKKTGEKISYDKGQDGKHGNRGKDHWHRHNPRKTGDKDAYLDKNGIPVPKNSIPSHIPAGGGN
jgi:RHS repeat-associated protein